MPVCTAPRGKKTTSWWVQQCESQNRFSLNNSFPLAWWKDASDHRYCRDSLWRTISTQTFSRRVSRAGKQLSVEKQANNKTKQTPLSKGRLRVWESFDLLDSAVLQQNREQLTEVKIMPNNWISGEEKLKGGWEWMEKCACQWNWLGEILVLPQSIKSFALAAGESGFNHGLQWGHTPYKQHSLWEFKNLLWKYFENSLFKWIIKKASITKQRNCISISGEQLQWALLRDTLRLFLLKFSYSGQVVGKVHFLEKNNPAHVGFKNNEVLYLSIS